MASLGDLVLTENPLNMAVDTIIATLQQAKDLTGQNLFNLVERGLGVEYITDSPSPDLFPYVTVWHEDGGYEQSGVQFNPKMGEEEISIYLYNYSFERNANGQAVDVQRARNNLVLATVKAVCYPEVDGEDAPGLIPDFEYWNFTPIQTVSVEHLNFRKNAQEQYSTLESSWYCTRIRLRIEYRLNLPDSYLDNYDT